MKKWLREEFSRDFIATHTELDKYFLDHDDFHDYEERIKFPLMKPPAFLQIDDRAITFTGVFPTVEEMKEFKPWNKKEE